VQIFKAIRTKNSDNGDYEFTKSDAVLWIRWRDYTSSTFGKSGQIESVDYNLITSATLEVGEYLQINDDERPASEQSIICIIVARSLSTIGRHQYKLKAVERAQ
jgi:hypothetical protein